MGRMTVRASKAPPRRWRKSSVREGLHQARVSRAKGAEMTWKDKGHLAWLEDGREVPRKYFSGGRQGQDHFQQESTNMGHGSNLPTACVLLNKVLLEHKHAHHWHTKCVYFHTVLAELGNWSRDYISHKAQNVWYLILCKTVCRSWFTTPSVWVIF
jgi:hypothetical protein